MKKTNTSNQNVLSYKNRLSKKEILLIFILGLEKTEHSKDGSLGDSRTTLKEISIDPEQENEKWKCN